MPRFASSRLSRILAFSLVLVAFTACARHSNSTSQFWRPISEPNLLMSLDKAQRKLDFDTSQCSCGIYPQNMTHSDIIEFQPDNQRIAATGVVVTPDKGGDCIAQPSLVVTECMRGRGWEPTNCSGRMPLANGGSLCAAYVAEQ